MSDTTSRRRFLGQGVQALGALSVAGRVLDVGSAWASPADSAPALSDKAVAFLKGRQDGDGAWSASRKEPGVTALCVTALLRSKRVAPGEPAVTKALG